MSNSKRSVARRDTIGALQAVAGLCQVSMSGEGGTWQLQALHRILAVLESHDSRVQHPTLQKMNMHFAPSQHARPWLLLLLGRVNMLVDLYM